jgi:hypothetical protein
MYLAIRYDDVDMIGSRPELLLKAFINWTKNPILGGRHVDSSSHSFIMTYIENSGIVGLGVWLTFFIYSWRLLRKEIQNFTKDLSLLDSVMIYVFLLSFFNPIGYVFEVIFAAFFIIPVWCVMLKLKEKNQKE